MRRSVLLALIVALVLVVTPIYASADVIDYDPNTDPPQILTPAEITKYTALRRGGSIPSVVSAATPNGQYILVSVKGVLNVLDIESRELTPVPADVWPPGRLVQASTFLWTSDTAATFMSCHKERPSYYAPCKSYAKSTFDLATMEMTSEPFDVEDVPGTKIAFSPYPWPIQSELIQLTDGTLMVPALAIPEGGELILEETESYEVRTNEERAQRVALGVQPEPRVLQADQGMIVAVNIETGAVTEIGRTPANTSVASSLSSLRHRPGSNVVSYLVQTLHPCSGESIRGRSCRGGGMPTSHPLVQEQLGLVPEAENDYILGSQLRLFDLVSGEETVLENSEYTPGRFASSFWTSDGSLLVVPATLPSVLEGRPNPIYGHPAHLELKVFSPEAELLRTYSDPILTSLGSRTKTLDGTRLLVMAPHNTSRHLYVVDIGEPEPVPEALFTGDGTLYSWELAGSVLVYVLGDVTLPGEMYIGEVSDVVGTSEAVTDLNANLRRLSNVAFHTVSYETSAGYEVEGIYIYPADRSFPPETPQPVVVWQMGGPGGQILNRWATSVESPFSMLPNFDIPVFMVNGSGRLSNGPDFYTDMSQGRNFGQRDILDVKEGVEHLIEMGVVDPDAVAVTGCSYGGYFTLQSLVEYPDFYAAGNTQCTLNDLMYEYNFGWAQTIGALMGRPPTSDPAEYVKDSPTYRAYRIKTPLLIFHGSMDFLPYEHMTNVHDTVEDNGVPVRFLRALGEGHGFGSASSQLYGAQLQIEWFREHLGMQAAMADSEDVVWAMQPRLRLVSGFLRSGR